VKIQILPAAALFGAALFGAAIVPGTVWAQTNPSAEQIVKSLTPTSTSGASRGIRVAPSAAPSGAPAAQPPAGPADAAPSASLSVLFATGSATLTPAATKILNELGRALTDTRLAGNKFRIEGHTDTVGTPDSNKALSEQRAKAVADYLASTYHVDPGKLEAVGLGEDGLLVKTPAQTPEARNRRVVVVNLGG
jgi:outer membrane protein OmpA-like peptidoglycan-associated protein